MAPDPRETSEDARTENVDGASDEGSTLAHRRPATGPAPLIRRFKLTVAEGPGRGDSLESRSDRMTIGSDALNDLVIEDPTVSRFHCEVRIEDARALVSDLRSKNGTLVDGLEVREAVLRSGCTLRLGRAAVRFEDAAGHNQQALSAASRFGALVGTSTVMRRTIALLERAAASDATILLEGETGTGKGKAAEAIHQGSGRRNGPLVVVDCGAIPGNLLESELFGHEKGAFTGADARRIGAFEEASGGTLFLDEIGELPADLQAKLLRGLESREIRRVGSNRHLPVDLRVVAATNRDLRAEVNAGRFRSDLYFRLAVVRIALPPLRDRPDDVPAIATELVAHLAIDPAAASRLLTPTYLDELARQPWPGNARELRNCLERALVFADVPGPGGPSVRPEPGTVVPYASARRQAQDDFERAYLSDLMRGFPGRVADAARAADMDRVYLYRLLRRTGIKP